MVSQKSMLKWGGMEKTKPATFTKMHYKDMLYVSGGIIFSKLAIIKSTKDSESLDTFLQRNQCYVKVKKIPDKFGKIIIFDKRKCDKNCIEYFTDERMTVESVYRSLLKVIFLLDKEISPDEIERDFIRFDGKEYCFDNFKLKLGLEKTAFIVTGKQIGRAHL